MPEIEETPLPGVGLRHEFIAEDGRRVGVIHHRSGRHELFVCAPEDPDAVALSLHLSEEDSHALSDALGRSTITENLMDLQQQIEGLAIDWLRVGATSHYANATVGDARLRTRTGVSVVAVIRGEHAFPAPGPEFRIEPGDSLVVVGTPEGIRAVAEILSNG